MADQYLQKREPLLVTAYRVFNSKARRELVNEEIPIYRSQMGDDMADDCPWEED